jgi:hypothetical protein
MLLAGAFVAVWVMLAVLARFIRIAPDWPVWIVAVVLTLVGGLLLWFYQYEAHAVGPQRARKLTALRLFALVLIAWLLLEPTLVLKVNRAVERELVILLDESGSMTLTDDGATVSRREMARTALEEAGLEKTLAEDARVRTLRFARTAVDGEDTAAGWNQSTDLAAALATVLETVPPEQLAGAILVTDGRHNRPSRVEESARRFGILDAPVGIVAVGSPDPPRDAAMIEVRSPEAIHLGDKMRITATLKFDGYKGKKAKVRLMRKDEMLEERTISIPQEHHREEVRFLHVPEEGGVGGFRIKIDPLEGERFADNNEWKFETSITEARTHVLLVDSFPRWEFRYLRNLFHGRDKSVHLQWVLTDPDGVQGVEMPGIPASASRPFGESAATALPENEAEWRKFDVIILGDLAPDAITAAQWQIISRCVNERAALLVLSAGPQFMPHALIDREARSLVPADFEWGRRTYYGTQDSPFRFELTAEGRRHAITRESAESGRWAAYPPIRWRHPLRQLRDGAEVLLMAAEDGDEAVVRSGDDLGQALEVLARRRELQAQRALLVARQTGRGKVALLLTDRTWRLREGSGDVHHHRFWGNLVRWGAGPLLRAGTSRVGLGSDQLNYTADDKITITARLRDKEMSPVQDESLQAEIVRDGKVIATVPLVPVEGSQGLHEAQAGPFVDPGRYRITLVGDRPADLLEAGQETPEVSFSVVASRGPVELADTTLNLPLLDEIATASGGKVVAPDRVSDLLPMFLGDPREREEIRETPLWDNAWIFALLALVLTAEWLMRRNAGLP